MATTMEPTAAGVETAFAPNSAEQLKQAAYVAAQASDMRVNVEMATDDGMTVNIGPQHPATHGTLRIIAKLDGEQVIDCEPYMGYMHRGYEKLTEVRTYPQITTLVNRIDWLSSFANEVPFILAAEQLMGIEAPPRAQWIRTCLFEMARIANVALFLGDMGVQLGAITPVFFAFRDREHVLNLMQRYGITRIYGRKAGEGTKAAERPMLISWLVFVLAFAAADARTPKLLNKVDLGATNEEGIRILQSLRPWAVGGACIAAIAVVGYTLRWWRAERERGVRGLTPKRRYLLATAVLFVVMLINPIVGLIGYVGAHAVEYFVIVHGALGRRYVGPVAESGGIVGRAVRSPLRATGCVIAYVIIVGVALVTVQFRLEADLANVILLTVGGMHVFFDGFIWKLRRPVVARSVAAA